MFMHCICKEHHLSYKEFRILNILFIFLITHSFYIYIHMYMAIDGFEPAVSQTQAQKWCRPYDPKPDVPKHT